VARQLPGAEGMFQGDGQWLNPSISRRLAISAENAAAWGSLPMRTFVAISQAEAALTNTSVENDSTSDRALATTAPVRRPP